VVSTTRQDGGVRFGVFDWVDARRGTGTAALYDERLRLLAAADESVFATYHLAEHHGTPLGLSPSPAVFLAAAARVTQRIRLAPTTFIVPLYEPLRLVQEICMLDQLSHGRLEVGVGKGSSPHEAAMFGRTPEQAAARFEETMPVLLAALETGRFELPSAGGTPVELHVRPYQQPHPPLWYPTSNAASIPRLGEEGYNVLFGFGFASPPLTVVGEQSRTFFEHFGTATEQGTPRYALPGTTPRFGILRHVHVADTDAEALTTARAAFADHYDNFTHLWRLVGSDRFTGPADFDRLVADRKLFVGSPATVAEQVAEAVETGGINYFAGSFAWGSLDGERAVESLLRFRDEVVPAVTAGPGGLGASA
jgi:alkanesulfonate monooxygenase SsuD/methylene tetrahydromethanopterin reductase-like flavin-dependent oxidoreductase (luciferase family)